MKIITSLIISLALAGSVFAGCPSKAIKGKFVSFDEESKTLTVKKGKKDQKVIKVPNPNVFKIASKIMVSRGIKRIISDKQLISL